MHTVDEFKGLMNNLGISTLKTREIAAMFAMQGILAKGDIIIPSVVAKKSIVYADALIAELKTKRKV